MTPVEQQYGNMQLTLPRALLKQIRKTGVNMTYLSFITMKKLNKQSPEEHWRMHASLNGDVVVSG